MSLGFAVYMYLAVLYMINFIVLFTFHKLYKIIKADSKNTFR